MKKITLFLCFLPMYVLSAQNVVEIPWAQGIHESVASPTIEVGDTVLWTWADASSKTVTSLPGGSEDFDSGTLKDTNNDYAYTFLKTGVTEYQNDSNPIMHGKVTVVNKLSTEDKFVKNLNFYPNPVKNNLTISSIFKIDSYQVYNVLGTLISEGRGSGNTTQVDMSRFNSGLYFVKVISKNMQTTIKIAKK
ncbi:T9SS type A sorting domain-containing protein [Aequorivita marisscotiae]|uniref:T9SS type A sorting domain-containing protein n=1 Tax=Aequorivita marisscotiae TaxID=3040348 RepID=A0ABY8KXK1_9FLAO|nr:T9SS type A sorting domain-containing protein [Aequorivita sp. Ant34-E75]WGF92457.1 T9SS type A sorting domain-containing protein [Aequorivita sp. Ant34-E75]